RTCRPSGAPSVTPWFPPAWPRRRCHCIPARHATIGSTATCSPRSFSPRSLPSGHQRRRNIMSTKTETASAAPPRRIPSPRGDKEILKVNIYDRMQSGNTQLLPLFPYFGEGAVVPCGAILRGEPGADWGHFFHWNTVDEVVVVYGGRGGLLQ